MNHLLRMSIKLAYSPTQERSVNALLQQLLDRIHYLCPDEASLEVSSCHINYDAIDRARKDIPQVFQYAPVFDQRSSHGLKEVLMSWRRTHGHSKDYWIANGDFIMAMMLEGYECKMSRDRVRIKCFFNCKIIK